MLSFSLVNVRNIFYSLLQMVKCTLNKCHFIAFQATEYFSYLEKELNSLFASFNVCLILHKKSELGNFLFIRLIVKMIEMNK